MEVRHPAYFRLPVIAPNRSGPLPREEGLRGVLKITATCRTDLHIGSGSPSVVPQEGALVHGTTVVSIGGALLPIIPGSSLKGAVRAVVEAISASCERVIAKGERQDDGYQPCDEAGQLCPACQIFGAPGWRATIAFGDLAPARPVSLKLRTVAQRYSFPHAPRRGRRLYGLETEDPLPAAQQTLLCIPRGSAFTGAIYLDGIDASSLGLVFLALGLGPRGLPLLRLGGGKNRGLGVVDVSVTSGRVFADWAAWLRREQLVPGGSPPAQLVAELEDRALEKFPETGPRVKEIRQHYSAGPLSK